MLDQREGLFVPVASFQQLHGGAPVHLGVCAGVRHAPFGLQLHGFEVVLQGRLRVTSVGGYVPVDGWMDG